MRLPAVAHARRHLVVALALAATAASVPTVALAGPAGGLAAGRDLPPVVVTVTDSAAARWIPGQRRQPVAPVLRTSPASLSAVAPVAAPTGANLTADHAGSYSFMSEVAPGAPIRWNACGVVHWTFNPANAPAGGLTAIRAAVDRIASVTGLSFAYDGVVASVPSGEYVDAQSSAAGFQPLLIGWSTPSASTLLANQPAGLVGMNQTIWARPASGATHIVSGVVALNANVSAPTSGASSWYTFALHEIAHGVGLGHTGDATQIMAPTIPADATDFGSGDLAGLTKLGGTC